MKYIDAEKLKAEIDKLESFSCISEEQDGFYSAISRINDIIDSLQQEQDLIIINKKDWEAQEQFRKNKDFGKPLQQEQPDVDLEKAARHVYESWMGGTMDDVRRDMVTLGTVLKARKEENK